MASLKATLVHYDPAKDVIFCCDTSSYGLGAVLCHQFADRTDQPIAYMSRTLSKAEQGYSHLEKEGLAVVVRVKKFHQYLYEKEFAICTDHKPQLGLLGEQRAIWPAGLARIQRWALFLSANNYKLFGAENSNADARSRIPLPELGKEEKTSRSDFDVDGVGNNTRKGNRHCSAKQQRPS